MMELGTLAEEEERIIGVGGGRDREDPWAQADDGLKTNHHCGEGLEKCGWGQHGGVGV